MTLAFVVKSIIELAVVVLLIVGFINEEKVVEFERTLFRAISIRLKLGKLRRAKRRVAQSQRAAVRLEALMALPNSAPSPGSSDTRAA